MALIRAGLMLMTTKRLLLTSTRARRFASTDRAGGESPVALTQNPPAISSRREAIERASPVSTFLTDKFQRQHDYLRISITEKCNLRCLYCMPEEGVPQSLPSNLLTSPEIFLLSSVFVSQGVTKIRLTGGEPTVRRDILPLLHQIGSLRSQGLQELCLTTNGLSLHRKLDSMVDAGVTGINLSLDTLDPWQFQIITRRQGFEAVMKSIERILEMNKLGANIKLKINCVIIRGLNERKIIPFVELGRAQDLEVRFIEYMPFDGNKWSYRKMLSYQQMLDMIRLKYPTLQKVQDRKNDTSKTYQIPGFVGKIGFITSMTHNFCGSCNRLRVTSEGNLKVCLFDNAEVSLRDIIRKCNDGHPIDETAIEAMKHIILEKREGQGPLNEPSLTRELLGVIGKAVRKKQEKHAGMGELENVKNRPMILIGKSAIRASGILTPSLPWNKIATHILPSSQCRPQIRLYSKPAARTLTPATQLTHVTPTGTAHMVPISSKASTVRSATAVCTLYFTNPAALSLIRSACIKKGDVLSVARIAGIMAAKRTSDLIPLCHPISISHVRVELEALGGEYHHTDGNAKGVDGDVPGQVVDPVATVTASWSGTDLDPAQNEASPFQGMTMMQPGYENQGLQHHQRTNPSTACVDCGSIAIETTVECEGKTGVEMEALTAASVAALTVYDMCKAVDRGMRIHDLRVVRKEGGMSGTWG